jgi:DNA-binding NarL/FixJ family response regulator
MDRSRQTLRVVSKIPFAAVETHFDADDTAAEDVQFETVIRVAPATWLCIVNSQTAPTAPGSADRASQVLAIEPHLQERLREVLDEIVHAQVASAAGNTACLSELTGRQREIVDMVRKGASNKIIARQLGLSVGTVKVHMHRIFRALRITNRVQLAMMPNPAA